MSIYGYGKKCTNCQEVVDYCNGYHYNKDSKFTEKPLPDNFYCVCLDPDQDVGYHFCSKRCIPKPIIRKIHAVWEEYKR